MKIGIITYHRANNLGASLQAYALQKKIEEEKGICEIIDYRCEYLEKIYSNNIFNKNGWKEKVKYIISYRKNHKIENKFKNFRSNFFKISPKIYNSKTINQANEQYDAFVTGSDQVWNLNLNGKDKTYLLDFVLEDKKRNSYAASIGSNIISDEIQNAMKRELEKYNQISIREKEGKIFVEKLINRDCELVLDPTLLLDKKEWQKIEEKPENNKPYIFLYIISNTPSIIEFTKKLAKEKKCDIICYHNNYRDYKGIKNIKALSPQEFLGYIDNAEYVVTSSFHGLCYAINYNKNFYYELENSKNNRNSRLVTLIEELKIKGREIKDKEVVDEQELDYNLINKNLEEIRKKSLEFIKKIGE